MTDKEGKLGWKRVRFGDVVKQVKDKVDAKNSDLDRYIAGEHMDTDDLHIRRWGLIGDNYLGPAFHMRFKPGQVLYGSRRTYLRKVAVPNFEGICANTTYVLETKNPKVLLPELLPFIMSTEAFHEHSITQSRGSVNPYINFSDLEWYEFALPPLDEQQRICDLLLSINLLLNCLTNLVDSKDRIKDSLGVCHWINCKKEMPIYSLETVCEKIQDGTHFSPKSTTGSYRYITSKNIIDGSLDLTHIKWISEEEHNEIYRRCDVKKGDILLTKDGVNTGNVAINQLEDPFSLLSSVAMIRVNSDYLSNEYLYHYIRSKVGKQNITSMMKGTAITRITLNQINSIKIPVPNLIAQKKIIEGFNSIDKALYLVNERIGNLKKIYYLILSGIGETNVQ